MKIDTSLIARLVEILWINILLSGDNAVVIALACRSLPPRQQRWGMILGTLPAVAALIGCAFIITFLMTLPYLKLAGGALLLWIAVNLVKREEEEQAHIRKGGSLWGAVRTIIVADLVMSLDDVVAVAAVAKGSMMLLAIGLVVSVPLVIFGSSLLLHLINRLPVLVVASGALIGYIAGDIAMDDPVVLRWLGDQAEFLAVAMPLFCGLVVVVWAQLLARRAVRPFAPD